MVKQTIDGVPSDVGIGIAYDTNFTDLTTDDLLVYDSVTEKWLNTATPTVDGVQFDITATHVTAEGLLHWNADDGTLDIGLPGGNVDLQIGQEMVIRAKNVQGSQISNGQVVMISGASGSKPEVQLVNNTDISSDEVIAIATEDVADNQQGYFTTAGLVRDIDTSAFTAGDELYLDSVDGAITNVRPSFPNFLVHVAHCIFSNNSSGIIFVHIHSEKGDDTANFFNGSFRESFDALVTSDGVTVTASIEKSGGGDLTMQFSDGLTVLDCTPACTITLTAGSDSSPQANYVYIPLSTKVLTLSTSGFPTGAEHIKVAYFFVPSATHTQSEGPYINQNWNDHLCNGDLQGHMAHIGMRVRYGGANYFSGIDANGTDQAAATSYFDYVSGSEAYFKSAAGVIMQMHMHTVPAIDTSVSGDDIHVVNWSGANYNEISLLNDIVADSAGGSLSNKYFNLFFFVVGNKTGEYAPVMCQLPSGSYATQTSAENDVDGFDNLTMPRQFSIDSSTGVPVCRMTLRYTGGTSTLTHISTTDLRSGGITAGGGAGGSATNFADNQFTVFNVTDNTKILDFDIGGVTTGNTRTVSVPDHDLVLDNITTATTTDLTGFLKGDGSNVSSQATIDISDDTNLTASSGVDLTLDNLTAVPGEIDHDSLLNFLSTEHFLQTTITNVSTALATGFLKVTTTSGLLSSTTVIDISTDTNLAVTNPIVLTDDTLSLDQSSVDHGSLAGLADDDHTQYSLVDGTRDFSGTVGGITPTADSHLVTKAYVDSLIQGLDWQESVLDKDLTTSPGAPSTGDRYIIAGIGGDWSGGTIDDIAEYNGSSWIFSTPTEGFATWVEDEDILYVFNGGSWVKFGTTVTHANLLGLSSDDHSQYLLASDATDRATFASNWIDLTDAGATTLHKHDHGLLDGLADDDHSQYILVDGSRAFTGTQSFGDFSITNVGDISLDSLTADNAGSIAINNFITVKATSDGGEIITCLNSNSTKSFSILAPLIANPSDPFRFNAATAFDFTISLASRLLMDTVGVTFNDAGGDRDAIFKWNGGGTALFVEGSSGNVMIGAGSPSTALEVARTGTDNALLSLTSVNADSGYVLTNDTSSYQVSIRNDVSDYLVWRVNAVDKMVLDTSGNLGIGTASPATILHLKDNNNPGGAVLRLENAETALADGEVIGKVEAYNNDVSGGAAGVTGFLSFNESIHVSPDGYATDFNLELESNGVTTNMIHIDGFNKNVGIGTTSPTSPLSLSSSTNTEITIDAASTLKSFVTAFTTGLVMSTNRRPTDGVFDDTGKAHAEIDILTASADAKIIFLTSNANNTFGTERMRIDKDGNVGIGTTPTFKLDILGTGEISSRLKSSNGSVHAYLTSANTGQSRILMGGSTNPDKGRIVFSDNADQLQFWTNDTQQITLLSSGNLGIGVTAPPNLLSVGVNSTTAQTNASIAVRSGNVNAIEWGHSNSAGFGSTIGYNTGNGYPFLAFYSEAGTTSNTYRTRGKVGSVISANTSGELTFNSVATATADNQSLTQRMIIDASGNVGIGIATPTANLDVFDSGVGNAEMGALSLINYDYGVGETGQAVAITGKVRNDGGGISPTGKIVFGKDSDYSSAANRDGNVQFYTNRSNTLTEAMRINSDGAVGVGTTSPGCKLMVNGAIANEGIVSFADGDTTPNVSGGNVFLASNTSATTITDFDGEVAGQIITIIFNDANTTITRANAYLLNSVNFTGGTQDTITLVKGNTNWHEVSRSTPNG